MTAFKECEGMRANLTDSNIIFLNRSNVVIIISGRVMNRGTCLAAPSYAFPRIKSGITLQLSQDMYH